MKKTTAVTAYSIFSGWASSSLASDKIGAVLPRRQIARNGEQSTAFALGGYHMGIPENPGEAERIVERSIELGVRFFDNARVYHNGRSEEYYGKFLTPKYRDEVFLMTKAVSRNHDDAEKELDASLRAMKTDRLDLWQIHTFTTKEDVDNRVNNGVLDAFLEAKARGKTRYIGFSSHQNPSTVLYFLRVLKDRGLEMDTCQMPLNVCDPSFESFQKIALPALLDREYGVIAMKTMAGGSMMGKRIDTTPKEIATEDIPNVVRDAGISYAELHRYVYALPVSTLCSGCDTIEKLEANVRVLQNLKKLSKSDMERLVNSARPFAGKTVENYKRVFG
ncbi:MAG: aldo/keto reductase [Cytophagales bacterium]|nr:aldo/keto reductase [Cytophagales bacterium]